MVRVGWMQADHYATGTKSAKGGFSLTDENGLGSEIVLTKEGMFQNLGQGDMVFNAQQRNVLWELSKNASIPNIATPKLPDYSAFAKVCGTTIENHYDSLVHIDNATENVIPKVKSGSI